MQDRMGVRPWGGGDRRCTVGSWRHVTGMPVMQMAGSQWPSHVI